MYVYSPRSVTDIQVPIPTAEEALSLYAADNMPGMLLVFGLHPIYLILPCLNPLCADFIYGT